MTEQEIFDQVFAGLKNQGFVKSVAHEYFAYMWEGAVSCRYRGAFDCKCAAGHIIPDDEYNDDMEFKRVHAVDYFEKNFPVEQRTFLTVLQFAHDDADSPEDMRERLIYRAREWGLVVNEDA
jgi:hypothetical protein